MIRHDKISYFAFMIAVCITIYFWLFEKSELTLFPLTLLLAGFAIEFWGERKGVGFKKEDSPIEGFGAKDAKDVTLWSVAGIVGFFLTSYGVTVVTATFTSMEITGYDAVIFSVLMAVSEEMFFRGAILDFMLTALPHPVIAVFFNGIVFGLYHISVYVSNGATAVADLSAINWSSFIYVIGGGVILSFISWRTKRLSPAIIAHGVNNIMATMGSLV